MEWRVEEGASRMRSDALRGIDKVGVTPNRVGMICSKFASGWFAVDSRIRRLERGGESFDGER